MLKNIILCCLLILSTRAQCVCLEMSVTEFHKRAPEWQGRTLLAFASWCSSCKPHLLDAGKNSDKFVVLVAFDEAKPVEQVLTKYEIKSPCIVSEGLVKEFKIDGLPWSKVLPANVL